MQAVVIALIIAVVAAVAYYYYRSSGAAESEKKLTVEELSNYTGHMPSVWGPQAWDLMHIVGVNFSLQPTDKDREAFSMFIAGLALVLPCHTCRAHFQELLAGELAIQPRDLVDRRSVFAWTVRLHAKVNSVLKKDFTNDVEFWFKHYTNLRQM